MQFGPMNLVWFYFLAKKMKDKDTGAPVMGILGVTTKEVRLAIR